MVMVSRFSALSAVIAARLEEIIQPILLKTLSQFAEELWREKINVAHAKRNAGKVERIVDWFQYKHGS